MNFFGGRVSLRLILGWSNFMTDKSKLTKEKIFKEFVPRSRVQLEVVKNLKNHLTGSSDNFPPKIISYQEVFRENGEYYLHYQGGRNLQPLAEYLSENSLSADKLLKELKEVLEMVMKFDQIGELFSEGINASNFWIDENEEIFLIPQTFLEVKQTYSSIKFEIPGNEYFMPPEIVADEEWDEDAYLFNLASVFYYFLSGKCIFDDEDRAKVLNKIKTENILEIKYLTPQLPPELNNLFIEMLKKDSDERININQAVNELEEMIESQELHIALEPFLQREDILENKIIKKKRRRENIKLFFRQSWKVILFFTVLGGGLLYGLIAPSPATITENTSSAQVVRYFYEGVARKNVNLADEAAQFELGEMQRVISESHVVEKMQMAFQKNNPDSELKQVYSLENLLIEKTSESEESAQFRVQYIFNFRDQEESYQANMVDRLTLKKIDDVWKITDINGGFSEMIEGNYPWRE